tara:strand:- start:938 stop:1357 length:420 start_codon:yes stop_codon:yes gene_type:complete
MALKEVSGKKVNLSRAFKDIAFGLKRNSITKDSGVVKNENAIKQAIRCLVLTQKGERLFQPDIGCAVFELLFEPLDLMTADAVRDEIINTLNQYEPRISLIDVTVNVSEVYSRFDVTVEYRIVGQPIVESVDFVLKRPE